MRRLAHIAELASHSFARPIFASKLQQLIESLWARETEPDWSRRDATWSRVEFGRLRHLLAEANADLGRAQVQIKDYERQLRDTQTRAQGQLEVYEAAMEEVRERVGVWRGRSGSRVEATPWRRLTPTGTDSFAVAFPASS